ALPDAARCEAHALRFEPRICGGQVVHPEAHVVERRDVHAGAALRIERLHQVDLDRVRAGAALGDVLVDVLALAAVAAAGREAEEIDPEMTQACLVGSADRDLLHAEHTKGTLAHRGEGYARSAVCARGSAVP